MAVFSEVAEEVQRLVAAAFGAAATGFIVWFKLRRSASNDVKETTANSATSAVIEMLRAEVTRLSEQNSHLAKMVNALQLQVIELHRENINLRKDVTRLKDAGKTS